jgi:ribose 5-phosphate isomerase A
MNAEIDLNTLKARAAERAVAMVESGMVLGLGSGSTALFALRYLSALIREGKLRDVVGVPTSVRVEQEATRLEIPLVSLDDQPVIDLTIDGADEVDPDLNLIKGGGGALLREKIVAQASRREVIVIDESKLSPRLGTNWAVPVEIVPFGWSSTARYLESIGAVPKLRTNADGTPYRTDQDNLILDCTFGPMANPSEIAAKIKARAGVVEHGLFLGLATEIIVASTNGIRRITRA